MPSAMSRPSEPVETVSVVDAQIALAELHHRALAERAVDLGQRRFKRPLLLVIFFLGHYPQCRL